MIEYVSDIIIFGMFAFIGISLGIAFVQWANYIEWELKSEERSRHNRAERQKNAKDDKTKPF